MKKIICFILIVFVIGCSACSSRETAPVSMTNYYFDTVVTITIYNYSEEDNPTDIINECFNICNKYDNLLSRTDTNSVIYSINNRNDNQLNIDSDVAQIITDSLNFSKETKGAFDITIAPLVNLWDIKNNTGTIPPSNNIKNALKLINYKNITVTNNNLEFKSSDTMIDLGAIAKGYVADKIKEYMKSKGVTSAIIDLGGNILTIGKKTADTDFVIGIKNPQLSLTDNISCNNNLQPQDNKKNNKDNNHSIKNATNSSEYIAKLSIDDKSVVTSGIYERFFLKNDIIFHHILDPVTGYPVKNNLSSVTIISDSSEVGDALSTAVFVMGLENGMKFINSYKDVEAIFVTNTNEIVMSNGLQESNSIIQSK